MAVGSIQAQYCGGVCIGFAGLDRRANNSSVLVSGKPGGAERQERIETILQIHISE
jgi:hypothetical protein